MPPGKPLFSFPTLYRRARDNAAQVADLYDADDAEHDSEDVISDKTGWVIRRKGTRYDAHHIIENTFDGEHEWWNIHPAKFPDEHQRGIHAKESPASEIFGGGKK